MPIVFAERSSTPSSERIPRARRAMSNPTIVVLDGYTLNPGDNPWDPVANLGELTVWDETPDASIVERAAAADIVLTNKTPLTAKTFAALPQLRFVSVLATGYNVIDLDAARKHGVIVANVPVYATDSVAQHVFALLLQLTNRVSLHDEAVREGAWPEATGFTFWHEPLTELAEKTLGVIGYGRIGRRVGEIGAAFGMDVIACSPSGTPGEAADPVGRWVDLDTLFSTSDVVSLNCALTDQNHGMVDAARLRQMKDNALLINTARGALVDNDALAEALRSGGIAGAGLDVVDGEPIGDEHPLLNAPNLFVTPHNAWVSIESRRRLMQITAQNIEAFLAGAPAHVIT